MSAAGSVDRALQRARALGIDRLDAALLLAHQLGRTRAWLLAHGDHALSAAQVNAFEADCRRRLDDVPLAYLVGEREFHGLALQVGPDVLVPRPETEVLADWALELLNHGELRQLSAPRVLDLGTGSGALALAVAAGCPRAFVTATDRSAAALARAHANGERLGLRVRWLAGHWWQAVGDERFDIVVANPPYVAEGDPHLPALKHEPQQALLAGPDGLAALREIACGAARHVAHWLLVEHGCDQGAAVAALLAAAGGQDAQMRRDLAGHARCSGARWRATDASGGAAACTPQTPEGDG
ncbi:MAG: peptide chain release factor N(5)-glutamine methyltransferase [Burkholderiaceae bacterium]